MGALVAVLAFGTPERCSFLRQYPSLGFRQCDVALWQQGSQRAPCRLGGCRPFLR